MIDPESTVASLEHRIDRALAILDGFGRESFGFDDVWELISDVRADLIGDATDPQ